MARAVTLISFHFKIEFNMNKIVVFSFVFIFSIFNCDEDSLFDKNGDILSRKERALYVPHQTGPAVSVCIHSNSTSKCSGN